MPPLRAAAALLPCLAAAAWAWMPATDARGPVDEQALEQAAADAEALAARFEALARDARDRADEAQRRADAARRRSNEARAILRRVREELGLPEPDAPPEPTPEQLRARFAPETDKHGAAARTARENKAFYLERVRASRPLGAQQTLASSFTFDPGDAPDMADLALRSDWQWAINVARGGERFVGRAPGSLAKTGHVDYARLDIRPARGSSTPMLWGIRRFNMGDVTVRDCDFTDIPREHGIYDEVSGHALYRGNTFLRLGGQAIQMAYRDKPFQQYGASNMPYTGKATYFLEDNHAVDTGLHASRSGFVWTFFDPGTVRFPATVVLRGCTSVQEWSRPRTGEGRVVGADHPRALRSPGGLMVHHYQHPAPRRESPATELLVIDDCLFDHTAGEAPLAVVRGVGTIVIEDSCFLAREHRAARFDVDDLGGMPSGRIVLQNNLSPEGMEAWLHVRGERVCSLNCPGRRVEIDVATLAVTESEPRDERATRLVSPLADRRAPPGGIHPQPLGHEDDLGTVRPSYR